MVDGATIKTKGVARAGVVADGGANVIVKNSYIYTMNGVLPADYAPTIDTAQMRSVPWMLSLSGNVRATNLLGTNTKASSSRVVRLTASTATAAAIDDNAINKCWACPNTARSECL